MNTNKIEQAETQAEILSKIHPAITAILEYDEPGYDMASGGSTQVLGDFLEFTDYLIPTNRIIQMYKNSRQSANDDLLINL